MLSMDVQVSLEVFHSHHLHQLVAMACPTLSVGAQVSLEVFLSHHLQPAIA